MKKLIYILALPILILSCSKDEATQRTEEIAEEDVLIQREVYTRVNGVVRTADFTYDGNKLMSAAGSDGYTIDYTYDSDLLTEVNLSQNGSTLINVDLSYNAGELSSYIAYFPNDIAERFDFTFNSETSITVKRYKGTHTDQTFETDINVVLENQNIKSVTFPNYSLQYNYDTNNCTYKNIFAIDILNYVGLDFGGFEGITNNPTFRSETEDGETETLTFNHTYNSQNFPETTVVFKNGVEEGTVEYFYTK